MKNENEILERLLKIEATTEEIYEEILRIRKENDDRILEQIHIMTRIENIADFIKTRYDVVVENNEEFLVEDNGK